MLRDIRILGYRGLRKFEMAGLGRLNLLVGTNNCGKTSVLEAIHMLSVPGSFIPLWQTQTRRGEMIESAERQIDVAHIVHGHKLSRGPAFHVIGTGTDGYHKLSAAFVVPDATSKDFGEDEDDGDVATPPVLLAPLMLEIEWR
jgi:hypothetical protein